ncbi:MAG: adenylate/guanylate cyclase domain-containing protein [Verrucomicrobiota bacterium]|nr:adenylate/guanylate cyclase domain-containing protein [Verrucomicrobiota bacterium]
MKLMPFKAAPLWVALTVVILLCFLRLLRLDFFERLEDLTYDLRAKAALHFPTPAATNLAFVAIEESSIASVQRNYGYGLYWPREVYGDLVDELAAEGARAVAFDIWFGDLRPDHPKVATRAGTVISSDEYFARQMRRAGNVILATVTDARLPDLFATNALALGEISTEKDADGVLRRVRAFAIERHWHPLFRKAAARYGLDLAEAKIEPGAILLPQTGTTNVVKVPIDAQTNFALADLVGDRLPPGVPSRARAFTDERVWQMGIVLASQALNVDLAHARVDLAQGRIILRGAHGVERVIPVDRDGYLYIDWKLKPNDPRLQQAPIENLLRQNRLRASGRTNGLSDAFGGKLVVVGSAAVGNDLTDRGATPLQKDALLVAAYWNVANSILTGQFIRRVSVPSELALILLLGALTAVTTLQLRAVWASVAVVLLMAGYTAGAYYAFARDGLWLPLVFPVGGAILMEHVCLVTYRVVFEEREQRRVKTIFSKVVSPDVVNELLRAPRLSLGGTQREVTVLFTDVRNFTALTDEMQERAVAFVRSHHLDPASASAHLDAAAHEILAAINVYLVLVADAVKQHGGTLDKYIGDCVMAFWGAPTPNPRHATACVRASVDAQRAIFELNRQRIAENARRETENRARSGAGLPLQPLLPVQQLGTGINTGLTTVGLVGSEAHQYNYTVFGREVNLAARLEGVSGSGRIIISESTFQHLRHDDPELAATCVLLPPVVVKGIRAPVSIYEVPWK